MKRLLAAIAFVFLIAGSAQAQNYTTVTAANIVDATGAKLSTGKLCAQAVDDKGAAISFSAGGGGPTITTPFCTPVTNGAVTDFQLANPALTSPVGIYYDITVKNKFNSTVLHYPYVTFSGATFDLDAYQPSTDTIPVVWSCSGCKPLSIELDSPDTSISGYFGPKVWVATKLTRVECHVLPAGSGTATVQLEYRTTPGTSGTSILSAPLTCSDSVAYTTSFAKSTIPANNYLKLIIVSTTGTPGTLNVDVKN